LLQIMPLARDIADYLEAIGEAHLRDLAQRRVRLLRSRRIDAGANPTLLRALLQRRHLFARLLHLARMADQLIDRRYRLVSPSASSRQPIRAISAPKHQARLPLVLAEERSTIHRGPRSLAIMHRSLTLRCQRQR